MLIANRPVSTERPFIRVKQGKESAEDRYLIIFRFLETDELKLAVYGCSLYS